MYSLEVISLNLLNPTLTKQRSSRVCDVMNHISLVALLSIIGMPCIVNYMLGA